MDRGPIFKIKYSFRRLAFCLWMPVLFILLPDLVKSQRIDHFSGDSTKFIGELNSVFSPLVANELKMSETLVKEFGKKWLSEKYDPSKKKLIYEIGNKMLRKDMRPYPDFYN